MTQRSIGKIEELNTYVNKLLKIKKKIPTLTSFIMKE
jgi:hypothetical protein